MKSLRTDDIIGAMPRVRHMPKNLYRQHQSYPYRHSVEDSPIKNYDSYYKSLGGKWDHSYNQNIYGNFPLSQYDPNPFVKDPNMNRSRYYEENEGLNRSQQYRESQYQGIYDKQRQSRMDLKNNLYDARAQEQNVKSKQAVFINYDQVKQFQSIKKDQKMYHQRKPSRQFPSKIPQTTFKIEPSKSQNPQMLGKQINHSDEKHSNNIKSSVQIGQRTGSSQPSHSSRTSQSKEKAEKNIFRGLGFNIISNSKYLYNVESSIPYVKKEI